MKPISQTFILQEPTSGPESVFITAVDLYFNTKSVIYGIELQIRTTNNGFPTQYNLPYASKILVPSQVNISSDGSVPTTFTFDTPVITATNQQLALVVIPVGGNPDYTIWTAALGDTDVVSGNPIFTNNQLGNLFISSNDLNFTPIQNESMKYNLYTAVFTSTSGTAVFKNSNTDYFLVRNKIGNFSYGEQVVMSNNIMNISALTITAANTLVIGETVVQPSTANTLTATATGVVYFANTSRILVSNTVGVFETIDTLKGLSSLYIIPAPTATNQNVSTTSACNVIGVPDANSIYTTDFAVGNYIYVATSGLANAQVVKILTADPIGKNLTVDTNINFSTNNAFIGRVKADCNLNGNFSSQSRTKNTGLLILDNVSSNSTMNFANNNNSLLIGRSTGSVATSLYLIDLFYDSITTQFADIKPKSSASAWSFSGITAKTKAVDTTYTAIPPDVPYEFTDKSRMIMSRSNEYNNPITGGPGTSSLVVSSQFISTSNEVSPYIDKIRTNLTLTHNIIKDAWQLSGNRISISNTSGSYNAGDTIWQSNSTVNTSATVIASNSSYIIVANIASSNLLSVGLLNANGSSIITSTNGAISNVSAIVPYGESLSTNIEATRYISKNVILADGQDSEDLLSYISAYRPAGTNLHVYSKILSASDGDTFDNKSWSMMPETSSAALLSSQANKNDFVELSYDFPQSVQIYSGNVTVTNASANVTFATNITTATFTAGMFIYLADVSYYVANASITAGGTGYVNGDTVALTGTAGFVNSTFTVSTNTTGGVITLTTNNVGSYISNTAIVGNTTSNTTGIGAGLRITVANSNFIQSNKFNVRKITSIPNTSTLIVSSNVSITSGNVAIGTIPGMTNQNAGFKYANNNNICRYTTSSDGVFDSFKTFAIKIVLISNTSSTIPRMSDFRCLALQV